MLNISLLSVGCTIFNLLLLFFVAKKFLFGRVDAILVKRMEEVDQATSEADEAERQALSTKKEYEDKIASIDVEKENILADIKKQGYEEYERIIGDAKKKGEQIITEARHNAEVENERAKEVYAAQLTDMVIDAASKIAATKHSSEDDKKLYDKFIIEAGVNNE